MDCDSPARRDDRLDTDNALDFSHTRRQHCVATQLAVQDEAGEHKESGGESHEQQDLSAHDRLFLTMVCIETMPRVKEMTAIVNIR